MDGEVFTIHQLQDALGLSYQPTYRLIHGYTGKKTVYTGILDKCPAVSPIDATVAETLSGIEIKRREKYFSFDVGIYREWMRQSDVWLKPDDTNGNAEDGNKDDGDDGEDDDFISSSHFRTETAKNENVNGVHNGAHSLKEDSSIDICTDSTGCFYPNAVSFDTPCPPVDGSGSMSDIDENENEPDIPAVHPKIPEQASKNALFGCSSNGKEMKTDEYMKSNKAGTTYPLPGILDHQDFCRSSVSLGHCTLCGEGPAVYQSKAQRAAICEKCYARLVREWNKNEGVV
jgi:ribosomal protein L40E